MMYLADYHVHTTFSSDGRGQPEEMVKSAIDRGFGEIAFTDHIEEDYPPVSYYMEEKFDYDEYTAEIERLRQIYGDVITIRKGVEIGLQTRAKKGIDEYFQDKEFDFIIGSTHAVDYKDLYDEGFFAGKSKLQAFSEYFEDVYSSAKNFDMYNVYGHLDAVARTSSYKEKSFDYEPHREIIDEILKLLIKKDKGIELNSSGIRYGLPQPHPCREILKRYRELGGEIITIGSDAHTPEHIGYAFNLLYSLVAEAGFKAIATFSGGKPVFIELK